ncbi:tlde1 domain-containing protein [Pokkaliibacter plantistimulans]|uniref:tlde1 domain-containing protein n=2 Tax=Pokkaliibacter plantistimulans TaxID=1635171 RepID=UPI000E30080B
MCMKIVFSISKGLLMASTPCFSMTLRATSGRGECMNKSSNACLIKPFEGPIPVGKYYISPTEFSDPGIVGDLARRMRGDWGDWRVRLHPVPATKTFGRDNFFLHGGDMEGSAGCIDVGGGVLGNQTTDRLAAMIQASQKKIEVEVKG